MAVRFADSNNRDLGDFKTPQDIKKIIDLSGERYRCVMQISFNGKITFLRLFNDFETLPSEAKQGLATANVILIGLLPALFAVFAAVFLIRRRRK